jgi:hypothetical protein
VPEPTRGKRWNVKRRLEFIEFRLFWEGKLNRRDLIDFFGISIPQATADLKQYSEIAPENLKYDSVEKAYVAPPHFAPQISDPLGNHYLAQLRMLASGVISREESWIGEVPGYETIPLVARTVDAGRLRRVLKAIRDQKAIHIQYQSLKRDQPIWRWISPHALGFNGSRWHIRSWCHRRNNYQDFLFARIVDFSDEVDEGVDGSNDAEWHTHVTFKIGPHPKLSEPSKKAIELDYNMTNGVLSVETRVALSYYFERQMNFDLSEKDIPAERQQVVWLNKEEVEAIRSRLLAVHSDNR